MHRRFDTVITCPVLVALVDADTAAAAGLTLTGGDHALFVDDPGTAAFALVGTPAELLDLGRDITALAEAAQAAASGPPDRS